MTKETVREIIEIGKDSKYIIVTPDWFSSADGERLRDALDNFINSDKVFFIISDGLEIHKVIGG